MDGDFPTEPVKRIGLHLMVCAAATKQLMNQSFQNLLPFSVLRLEARSFVSQSVVSSEQPLAYE
jgi:hypothetical protein